MRNSIITPGNNAIRKCFTWWSNDMCIGSHGGVENAKSDSVQNLDGKRHPRVSQEGVQQKSESRGTQ